MATRYARVTVTQEFHVELSDVGITPEEVRQFHNMDEWDSIDDHDIYQVFDAQVTCDEVLSEGTNEYTEITEITIEEY